MRRASRLFVAIALLFCAVSPAKAQLALADLQSKVAGAWLTTVEGEQRDRRLIIESVSQKGEGTYLMVGTFNFVDQQNYAFKDGEIQQASGNLTIAFMTGAGSSYTLTAKPDGTFGGTTKYKNGQVKNVTMTKWVVVTEFDGKWSGNANSNVGQQCVSGVYDISVKEGKVSGTATFNSGLGAAVSTVTGEVRSDRTMALRLVKQQQYGRTTRFQAKFDDGVFVAVDPVVSGGQCSYDVKLKKDS